jgi:hypothetical protein
MVAPERAGDPTSDQKWIRSSLRSLSQRLGDAGHPASPPTVGRLLKGLGYSLKVNVKTKAGEDHPDRDKQFEHIEAQVQVFWGHRVADYQRRHPEEGVDWRFQERRTSLVSGTRVCQRA